MRTLLGCLAVLGLAVAVEAAPLLKEDKKDDNSDKIVGKWAPIGADKKPTLALTEEFTKDGKYFLGGSDPKGSRLEGTYKVEGTKLTITVDSSATKRTIKKITATDLEFSMGKGTAVLKKVK